MMDSGSVGGIILALLGILAGLIIEGGSVNQVLQPTAAMIVFGGTFGAVLLQYPLSTVLTALRRLARVFFWKKDAGHAALHQIVEFANKARRHGIVSLDQDLESIEDPFLRQAVMLAVDGTEPSEVRSIMELQLNNQSEAEEKFSAVFEAAGGFSPTIGIIGAIIGLIQVMQHLNHINQVGRGIAVAFVATIYGVASANLFFLPIAGKLKIRVHEEQRLKEMAIEGVVSIIEGMNPRILEVKLQSYLTAPARQKRKSGKASKSAAQESTV